MATEKLIRIPLGAPSGWLVSAAASIGLDYGGLTHEITNHFQAHVMSRHGDPAAHGRAAVAPADFDRIAGLVAAPDFAVIGAERFGKPRNAYAKVYDDLTFLYFDEALMGKRNKTLRGATFYKVAKPADLAYFLRVVRMNEKTDITRAKILAAGSQPGWGYD
jgi:hypothetical protein